MNSYSTSMPEEKKEKKTKFKISLKTNFKQVIVIVFLLGLILSIPFIITYIQSPTKISVKESISQTIESFKPATSSNGDEFIVTLPLLNTDLNLSILKKNPKLLTYAGLALLSLAILIGITILKNIFKKD